MGSTPKTQQCTKNTRTENRKRITHLKKKLECKISPRKADVPMK